MPQTVSFELYLKGAAQAIELMNLYNSKFPNFIFTSDPTAIREMASELLCVCILNEHVRVADVTSVQNKLQNLSRQTKVTIKKIVQGLGFRVGSVRPNGKLLDLHEVSLQTALKLMKADPASAQEGIAYLGINMTNKEGSKIARDGFVLESSAVYDNAYETLYYNKYSCYFRGCRKTYESVRTLTSHYKIHVRTCKIIMSESTPFFLPLCWLHKGIYFAGAPQPPPADPRAHEAVHLHR